MSFARKKVISINRGHQKVCKVVVITLAKNLGEGSYPTEKQNQEHAFSWKSDNTKKPPSQLYERA